MKHIPKIISTTCFLICLGLLVCSSALAESNDENNAMYLDALRAISENRYDDAKNLLTTLIERLPNHGGAWLDLAIMQCGLGNKEEAEKLFNALKVRFPLSFEQRQTIEKLQAQSCIADVKPNQYSLLFEHGYDSNVNQGASNPNFTIGNGPTQVDLQLLPEYQPKADRFSTLSFSAVHDHNADGFSSFAQLRARNYETLSTFNTVGLAAGIERPWSVFGNRVRTTGMIGFLTLGGRLYQKQEILQLRVNPKFGFSKNVQISILSGLTNVQYPTLTNYDARTWEIRGLMSYDTDRIHAQAGIALLADRALGERQGGNRRGYFYNATIRGNVYKQYEGELGWSKQLWQSALSYSPGLIDQARRQETQMFRMAVVYPLKNRQSIQLELRAVDNKENISILQYNSKMVQLSWQWQNF